LSALSKIKTVNWKNGWPVIHFVRGETNQLVGHPTGYPEDWLDGNPYNQLINYKLFITILMKAPLLVLL
jgi:hypothetical protein